MTNLEPKLRAKAFHDIEILQEYGTQLKGPYMKSIKGKNIKICMSCGLSFQMILREFFILHIIIKRSYY